jgi:hypothetical protein
MRRMSMLAREELRIFVEHSVDVSLLLAWVG